MNSLQGYGSDSDEGHDATAATATFAQKVNNGKTAAASERQPPLSSSAALAGGNAKRRAIDSSDDESDNDSNDPQSDIFGLTDLDAGRASAATAPNDRVSSSVRVAPDVAADVDEASSTLILRPTDTEMHVNIPFKDMQRAVQGPENPFASRKLGSQQNTLTGYIESASMTEFDFRNQQKTFETLGYARDPNSAAGEAFVGDLQRARRLGGATAMELRGNGDSSTSYKHAADMTKRKRKGREGDTSIVEGEGAYVGPWGGWEDERKQELAGPSQEEIQRSENQNTERQTEQAELRKQRQESDARGTEKSQFHGKSMYDYQGRTYMHVPTDVDVHLHGEAGDQESFLPKACIHTWTGHTKGISALRLFPGSGHLLLSASMDSKVKLWDVYREGTCLRTFMGHSKAVKDVTFSNDGRRFLSAGYDRQMKLWDTETGQCIQAFSNGKMPHVVKFHPDDDKQHVFLAGMSDKKIIQFDVNTGEITQEYDSHLGAINTITFVDENRRFVTTSDDKTMRAWDYDIPVVIKYVADPLMHSMPAVSKHPNAKWLACQSLDSQILVYAADSFRQNRKKVFKGHNVSGYACQIGFSPDGRFISSGDGLGNLVFWDWKSGRLLKRLHGHKEVVITHAWLPHESSKVVTGSWDGTIKLWD